MEELSAIVLAAGEGKRMRSNQPKVLHQVCGKALVEWVCDAAFEAGIQKCITVVGHKAEEVMAYMGQKVQFALQKEQLGTGHAVMQAQPLIKDAQGYVIILCGDTPLIKGSTVKKALDYHISSGNAATVITTELEDATGYGRIIRDASGQVKKIVEHRDTNEQEKAVREINSGIYCFTVKHLLDALNQLNNHNSQGEYYLTDTIEILIAEQFKVGALKIDDSTELLGINNRIQLSQAEAIMQKNIVNKHMENGVTIMAPATTLIHSNVEIGGDTIIYPGCIIEGDTKIQENCMIGPNSRIINSIVEDNVEIQYSVVVDSYVGRDTHIGPFAYLRPGSKIGKEVKIGDFVEVKNAVIGDKSKVSHLTYIGDAEVGKNVNMGCGTVVVNYDGQKKHKTIIGDNAFVGCNTNLVSPVVVNENAYIAAGSTITDEVPKDSLAIARQRQIIKQDWVKKRRGLND